MKIDVWSDIACPWCWVGKRKLEAALLEFEHGDQVEVVWRAFELDPSAPRRLEPSHADLGVSYIDRLAQKYGTSPEEAAKMIARMTETAAEVGAEMCFDRIQPGNTFDAHRLLHLAHASGLQGALKERLLRAYLGEGEAIGDPEALLRLALEVGLSEELVRTTLEGERFVDEVRSDESQAAAFGIRGVPFFVFANKYGVSGAQPSEVLLRVLERAWAETVQPPRVETLVEGAVCGPDGCA